MHKTEILLRHLEADTIIQKRQNEKKYFSYTNWWQEIAGVWILSPRQTGKTSALIGFCESLKNLYPNNNIIGISSSEPSSFLFKDYVDLATSGNKFLEKIQGLTHPSYHVVIDEFMYLSQFGMRTLLDYDWRSVTGVSSMKI